MDRYITFIINPDQKIYVPRKNIFLTANDEGLLRFNVDDLLITEKTVIGFEKELEFLLTEDQQFNLYEFISKNNAITITALSSTIEIERSLAKVIINLAMSHKVLITGWNNTWKVADKIIKERMADRVRNRHAEAKKHIKPESLVEGATRNKREMDDMTKKYQEEHGIKEKPEEPKKPIKHSEIKQRMIGGGRVVSQEEYTKEKHPQQDSSVIEVIEPSEEMLQKQLKELEIKKDKFDGWNTNNTIHDVVNEINAVKRKLQVFENKRASEKYKKENSTPGFSIVEGIKKEGKGLTPILMSKTKILSKKKPVPGKPLGKR